MFKTVRRMALAGALVAAVFAASPARSEALPLTFECVSGTLSCENLESAFTAELLEIAGGVSFTFYNNRANNDYGLLVSTGSITEIRFDLPTAFGPSTLIEGSGVDFRNVAATAPDRAFEAEPGFLGLGRTTNGIQSGEWLRINFALLNGSTFTSVLDALTTSALKISLGVDGLGFLWLGNGDYANNAPGGGGNNPAPVPEPATLLLLGSGLAGAASYARRRRTAAPTV